MGEETTVTVETTDDAPDVPAVVDSGDTVIVVPPTAEATPDPYLERFMQTDERLNALTTAVESLASSIAQTQASTVAVAEEVAETQEAIAEVAASDYQEDVIVPQESHPWFRSFDDWRD
jgi:hypothetical protein